MFSKVAAEAETPGLRASAFLAEAFNAKPKEAWVFTQKAMEDLSIDSPRLWDECRTRFRLFDVAEDSGHYEVAVQMAEQALDLSRRCGWARFASQTAGRMACLYAAMGRHDEAAALIDEAVLVARRILGPTPATGEIVELSARVARLRGDIATARRDADEAAHIYRQSETVSWLGTLLTVEAALIERDDGDLDQALRLLGDATERLKQVGNTDIAWWQRSLIHTARASIELRRDDPGYALEYLQPLLAQPEECTHLQVLELVDLASIALAQQGRVKQAALLKGALDRERERVGLVVPPSQKGVRDAALLYGQSVLEDEWQPAVERGRAMTLDEAIDLAASEANAGPIPRSEVEDTESGVATST